MSEADSIKQQIKTAESIEEILEIVDKVLDVKNERIQELEEEKKKYIVQLTDKEYRNLVDIIRKEAKQEFEQKVKDKIERHEFAKKYFEKEYDNKHYEDDGIRARDFYGIVTQDRIIQVLEELLEDK